MGIVLPHSSRSLQESEAAVAELASCGNEPGFQRRDGHYRVMLAVDGFQNSARVDIPKQVPSNDRCLPYQKVIATLRERYRRCACMRARIIEPDYG